MSNRKTTGPFRTVEALSVVVVVGRCDITEEPADGNIVVGRLDVIVRPVGEVIVVSVKLAC